jgi:predicted transcriptional regulator
MTEDNNNSQLIELTADLISAYVSNNPVPVSELPALINQVHQSLSGLSTGTVAVKEEARTPAVSIKKSITPDYLICLEDGKRFKSLKRHIGVHFNLTPDQYREKWNLPLDYPMVAPAYAAARSELAKKMGLGRKPAPVVEPVKRGRKKAA